MLDRVRKAREFLADAAARQGDAPRRAQPSLAREALLVSINPANVKPG